MFKKLMLKLAKSVLGEVVEEILQAVVDEVQEEVEKLTKLTEKERAAANMVLDLVEERAVSLLADKLASL